MNARHKHSLAAQLAQAVNALNHGGIIVYPTEAVYGLGCDPDNEMALQRLLTLKSRDKSKGLILISDNFARLKPYLKTVSDEVARPAFASWPGAVTWLWPVRGGVSPYLHGKHDTLAVRVSAHPLVSELCRRFGKPIVSTSANPEGKPPARSIAQVGQYFADRIDVKLAGNLGGRDKPSAIRDLRTGEVIRA